LLLLVAVAGQMVEHQVQVVELVDFYIKQEELLAQI
jgi:hypothetical protein